VLQDKNPETMIMKEDNATDSDKADLITSGIKPVKSNYAHCNNFFYVIFNLDLAL
jgi:hypothetical protein